jgi:hypothetical protein
MGIYTTMRHTNLSGFNPIQKTVPTSGTPVKLSPYFVATTIAFNNNSGTPPTAATNDTITDSDNGFLSKGFKAGDMIVISGSTSNDGTYEAETVVAGTITLKKSGLLTTEIAGNSVTVSTLHGIKVEDGVQVVLKAKGDNTGTITIGPTSARALNTNTDYFSNHRLSANQAITLQVKNLDEVWADATVSGEGLEVLFEA